MRETKPLLTYHTGNEQVSPGMVVMRHAQRINRSAGTLALVLLCLPVMFGVQAAEYIAGEETAPTTVEDAEGPMKKAFAVEAPEPSAFPALKKRLEDAPPFWRDTQLSMQPRVYYFDRHRENLFDSQALAYGGGLVYGSGWWRDRIKLNASLYTTQKAYGPDDKDGTLLLKPGQEGFSVLGEANVELKLHKDITATLYRQAFDLPYINRDDSRMVPNTFEAYTVVHTGPGWDYGASHVTQMKRRFSDEFVSMSEAAGFSDTDEPMTLAGFSYNFNDDMNIGAINLYSWDHFNTLYAEANAVWSFRQGQALRLGGQFTHQKDVGDAIGGDFDTFVYSGKVSGSWRNAIITLAFSSTDDDARIRSPYGGYPGYLSLMLSDFNRAGEDAWLAGASYDFTSIGVPGLSGFANYARGYTPDSGSSASSDQSEFDITVDYRFQSHAVKGLWLRARAAFLDQDEDVAGGFDVRDYRVILNYTLPLL
jgi:hypothetical protein